MLEHLWRHVRDPQYFPSVWDWLIHIPESPATWVFCVLVGALCHQAWQAIPFGAVIAYLVFLSDSSFYGWGSIFPLAGLPALFIEGALMALLGLYARRALGQWAIRQPSEHWLRRNTATFAGFGRVLMRVYLVCTSLLLIGFLLIIM